MKRSNPRWTPLFCAVGVFALSAVVSAEVQAQAPAVDPAAEKEAEAAKQEAAAGKQQAAATTPPPAAAQGKPLPLGTVVHALPQGCVSTSVGGVEYCYGGGNSYRAVFQDNQVVYVTARPK